jgi:hypothetical protein
MLFSIKVNGTTHSVDVDGDTPLLWVLRDVLGMTGTKFDCGAALGGACTVHLDGAATRSCVIPIASIGSSAIALIEAIGETPEGKALQQRLETRSGAMRLLPIRADHVGRGATEADAEAQRRPYRRRHVRKYLPLQWRSDLLLPVLDPR